MKPASSRRILFVTWDGPQITYLERLFLPAFRALQARGYVFHVLQFSWDVSKEIAASREAHCAAAGIPYRAVTVARGFGPFGPLASAFLGARHIRRAMRDWSIDTIMPRSLLPALSTLLLGRKRRQAVRVIFDADGLSADERVDFAGMSPHSLTYRALRDVEAEMLRCADVVLTRTEATNTILQARAGPDATARYQVVSNGVDTEPFAKALQEALPIETRPFTLCYCGSIGPQYRVPEMFALATRLRQHVPDLRFRIFTRDAALLAADQIAVGLDGADWISNETLSADAVPHALAACDLALALRAPAFSTRGVLPIKYGEYLLAGLPIIGTPGVGGSDLLIREGVFSSGEASDLMETIDWVRFQILPNRARFRGLCHEAGLRHFSLGSAVTLYERALAGGG